MADTFLWGAATSAHQVEGHNIHNDWWAWEKAQTRRPQSGAATDHYHRFREDFALAKSLGHTAHRLSLEWSRFEYNENSWSHKAVAHYREVLQELRRLKLTSFVTLHHFTNPQWIAQKGGWENPRVVHYFERYVRKVVDELGELVDFWVTINEPMVYALQGYWNKKWPPQVHSLTRLNRVINNLASAHTSAYHVIHKVFPEAKVGLAQSAIAYEGAHAKHSLDIHAVAFKGWLYNHRFFSLTPRTHDYIGLNYYFGKHEHAQLFPPRLSSQPMPGVVSDLNWPSHPAGLTNLLLEFKRYKAPLYILENGLADANDSRRADYLRQHIRAVEAAQEKGADVRGYFHWSLLDNFEWAEGFTPRFGLVEVDYKTLARRPRVSAYVYKAIIEQAKV